MPVLIQLVLSIELIPLACGGCLVAPRRSTTVLNFIWKQPFTRKGAVGNRLDKPTQQILIHDYHVAYRTREIFRKWVANVARGSGIDRV